jgi:cystathionine beta-lyase family protein involved in aluminum resistance
MINIEKLIENSEKELIDEGVFGRVEKIAFNNQKKVMEAFREYKVSDSYFAGTSGYGYDDKGRDMLADRR